MKIERKFTKAGQDAYADIEFVTTSSEIRNPDGTVVFHLENVEVPKSWSQVASDVIAQKYFRKAGVPVALKTVREKDVPEFLWRSVAEKADTDKTGETSAKQVFNRLAGAWAYWVGKVAISPVKKMPKTILTKCAICWQPRWPRQTRHNGLTPACIGPMELMGQAKAISMLITKLAS